MGWYTSLPRLVSNSGQRKPSEGILGIKLHGGPKYLGARKEGQNILALIKHA